MAESYDVCVIGSGAGGGPVAMTLAEAGYSVCLLEKGPWRRTEEFTKDEIGVVRRDLFVPDWRKDPHVFDRGEGKDRQAHTTSEGWNAVGVGGASVIMSGFFYRLRPEDFRLKSTFGPVEGGTVEDWPISYDDLEPWYAKVEQEIGVSGKAIERPDAPRRSTPDFPFPPLREHPFAARIDETCRGLGLHPYPLPRAVLSQGRGDRKECSYTRYCASFGCATRAKGSSLVACVPRAVRTGRCTVRDRATAYGIATDPKTGKAVAALYHDAQGTPRQVEAGTFVVACQAIETARLLLLSGAPKHPKGLANSSGQVGRNLLFSTFGACWGDFLYEGNPWLPSEEPFVNRSLDDYMTIDDPKLGKRKGGALNFLLMHGDPISAASVVAFQDKVPLWGPALKRALKRYFVETQHLKCEIFGDYTPTSEGSVFLDPWHVKDPWGMPSARVRVVRHPRDKESTRWLIDRGVEILKALGAATIHDTSDGSGESTNLVAGTCRFGSDPATSVLNPDCRAWDCENLWITDGSFMPTGGSVPYTMTIYANAFRVADKIVASLGGPKKG